MTHFTTLVAPAASLRIVFTPEDRTCPGTAGKPCGKKFFAMLAEQTHCPGACRSTAWREKNLKPAAPIETPTAKATRLAKEKQEAVARENARRDARALRPMAPWELAAEAEAKRLAEIAALKKREDAAVERAKIEDAAWQAYLQEGSIPARRTGRQVTIALFGFTVTRHLAKEQVPAIAARELAMAKQLEAARKTTKVETPAAIEASVS